MIWNSFACAVISADRTGVLDYWAVHLDGDDSRATSLKDLKFVSKSRTDLYLFAKNRFNICGMAVSKDGTKFAIRSNDLCVRVFSFLDGKCQSTIKAGESVAEGKNLGGVELGRRKAREKELVADQNNVDSLDVAFDPSGNFVLYSSIVGVHVVDAETAMEQKMYGENENAERFMKVAVLEGKESAMLAATAFKSQRVYLFTSDEVREGRDIWNEKPMVKGGRGAVDKSERIEKIDSAEKVTLHTSEGDIIIRLLGEVAPKAVENFVGLSKKGYYDGCTFHRVIKGFMVQTGDPGGDGRGGESIWGKEFEDEFDKNVIHEIGTVSMANAGPNTNGSVSEASCDEIQTWRYVITMKLTRRVL